MSDNPKEISKFLVLFIAVYLIIGFSIIFLYEKISGRYFYFEKAEPEPKRNKEGWIIK